MQPGKSSRDLTTGGALLGCVPRLFADLVGIPPVRKLCQNPICLRRWKLLFERKQLPQVVDNRHFRIELMERLEPEHIFRNQQVAGSIPAGGSMFSITYRWPFLNGLTCLALLSANSVFLRDL